MPRLRCDVLGPLRVTRDGAPVRLAGQPAALLAALASRAGQAVPTSTLIDTIWPGDPPASAHKSLQIYVYRLRRLCGERAVQRHEPGGYLLAGAVVDAAEFAARLAEAREYRRRGALAAAEAALGEALARWRGPAYSGLTAAPLLATAAATLEEQRLGAIEERVAVVLDRGRAAELAGTLPELVRQHPFRERLLAYLMVALYRDDRRVEALAAYESGRERLAEELGVEPGPLLAGVYRAVQRGEPGLFRTTSTELESPGPAPLPGGAEPFVGRAGELRALSRLAAGDAPLILLTGPAGAGKTALALRWARSAADRYPDGMLYLDLRGFAAVPALDPVEALAALVRALGAPGGTVPDGLAALRGRYLSLTATGRRLIVLDNALDAAQVRPLLPSGPEVAVLVTSRHRLRGLSALDDAAYLPVDPLPAADFVHSGQSAG